MFRYLMYDYYDNLVKQYPVGSKFESVNVINGVVTDYATTKDSYQNWILFTCDKPNHKGCCEIMTDALNIWCREHGPLCPDRIVVRNNETNEIFLQAENAEYVMNFCPWCGTKVNV